MTTSQAELTEIKLQLHDTTLGGPVEGPWEIRNDRYRLTLAATPRGPGIAGWQITGGPELVGSPHPLCDLIPGGFVTRWQVSTPVARPAGGVAACAPPPAHTAWSELNANAGGFANVHDRYPEADGVVYLRTQVDLEKAMKCNLLLGHDGGARLFLDGRPLYADPETKNPAIPTRARVPVQLAAGNHDITLAFDLNSGRGYGVFLRFEKTPAAAAETLIIGGRQALCLLLATETGNLTLRQRLIVFPGSPVIQLATTVENSGAVPLSLDRVDCGGISLATESQSPLLRWIIGADNNSKDLPGPARCVEAPIAVGETRVIDGRKSNDYIPWFCCQSGEGTGSGVAMWLDYLGAWQMGACRPLSGNDRGTNVQLMAQATIGRTLAPGESLSLPVVTFCPFTGGLDAMMETIYDWQYTWQWDLVGQRYFARSLLTTPWYMDVHNLQENWAGRLADLDLTTAERARSLGFGMLWDDAGWSEGIDIWCPTREGPDFRLTRRYLAKMDLTWLLWFCGQPPAGILDAKRAAWGDFQWRTDGEGDFDHRRDGEFRAQISSWRERYRHGSFHSCDGGSRYAHTFGIQRLGDTHMLADPGDPGTREVSNWYLSYFEVPDKWHDLMPSWYSRGLVDPCSVNQVLAMTPAWDTDPGVEGHDRMRRIALLYRYFLAVGLAGRWSYQHHPAVEGDVEWTYVQRTSHDKRRACLILKQQPRSWEVKVRPTGLLDDHLYEVGYLSRPDATPFMTDWSQEPKSLAPRSGRDLMQNGIVFSFQSTWPGEIVFLGCVDRPGSGRHRPAPEAPGRVLIRRETNLGHAGVGLYWSPVADPHGTHRYEVRRGGVVIGTAAQGCHFFDHDPGADTAAQYAVRTVDIDNHTSGWTNAIRLPDEPFVAWALGGHFPEAGRDGWSAEHLEATGWQPMVWVPRPFSAAGDHGGTGRQPGGVEGWWEAADGARVGRGWQQAGSSGACARLWTVPASGQYRIVGRPVKERYRQERGGSLRGRILINSRQVWPATGWSDIETRKDTQGQPHDLRLDLQAGDVVRFVLDQGANSADDVVAWMPAIHALPNGQSTTAPESVVRIACGRSAALTGADGNRWDEDLIGQGGIAYTSERVIEGTTNPSLLQSGRVGSTIRYAILLPPELYAVRLHWAETLCHQLGDRVFNVDINGRRVLRDFDVIQAAQGADRAWDEVFRYQVPDADGRIVVELIGSSHPLSTTTEAFISAIEVLPESGVQRRITCGSDRDWIDWSGQIWTADGRTKSDEMLHTTRVVWQANPTLMDQGLYQSALAGEDFTVIVPLPPGLYSVHLLIAELWQEQAGRRPMDIWINGQPLATAWDPAIQAGTVGRAADLRLDQVAPGSDGCITVRCRACGECPAILQAIAID